MPIFPYWRPLLAACLLVAAAVHAEPAALTLGEAIARAQQSAPSMQGAEASLRAATAGVQLAGQRPNPTLSVEAENIAGSGRYAGFGGSDRTVSLSVPLELGGKRAARIRAAEAEREYATAGAGIARADLTLATTQAFIAAAAGERRQATAAAALELAERAAHAARERVRAGKASPIEEQRAEVQRLNAQVRADRMQRAAATATATLARLTGSALPLAVSSAWFERTEPAAMARLSRMPLPLAAADAQVVAAQARVHLAQSARTPDVTVNAGVRRLAETRDHAAVLSLSVPLPLFSRGGADVARAQAEFDRAQADRRGAAAALEGALGAVQSEAEDALAAAAASRLALAAACEAARIARIGYAEGKFSQLDLLEAERSLTQTREAAIDSLAALHEARARLAHLQGDTAPIYKD